MCGGEETHLAASAAGDDVDVDLGLAEGGGRGGEDDVAHESELATSSELCVHSAILLKERVKRMTYRVTADGGDDGLADGGEEAPALEELALEDFRDCIQPTFNNLRHNTERMDWTYTPCPSSP